MRRLLFALIAWAALSSAAEDRLVFADTRPGVRVGYWLMVRPGATATVMLHRTTPRYVVQVWPPSGVAQTWPPTGALDDAAFAEFSRTTPPGSAPAAR